jgi:hypothetical protein
MTGTRVLPSIRESSWWQAYMRSRYGILFYALLVTLLMLPIAATIGLPAFVIKLLLGACLLAAIMPNATKGTRLALFTSILLLVGARWSADKGALLVNPPLILALGGSVGLLAAAGTLRFAVKARSVDSETIYAALSTYLLAGIFCGEIYWAIEGFRPGSVVGPDPLTEVSAVYYSFVTLATLGYGDYLPRTDLVRGVATFEVIGGQLFLAVMVARLIGSFAPAASPERPFI